jgi:hypothetical protein
MVTALGGCAATAATILLASVEAPTAAEFDLAVNDAAACDDPEISAFLVGETKHV